MGGKANLQKEYVVPVKIPNLEIGQKIKLNVPHYDNAYGRVDVKGVIVAVTKYFFTVDIGKYRESFMFSDISCRRVNINGSNFL